MLNCPNVFLVHKQVKQCSSNSFLYNVSLSIIDVHIQQQNVLVTVTALMTNTKPQTDPTSALYNICITK